MNLDPIVPPLPDNEERRFSGVDPLDGRYFDPAVSQYLSEQARVSYQAYVEAALAQTLAEFGVCDEAVAKEIDQAARTVTAGEVFEEEQKTRHDVKALVNVIKSKISDNAKPYVHMTATSYDIVSTASAVQYKAAFDKVIIPRLNELMIVLIELTEKYADTVQIGRTHGQHGVPITFGFALAEYVSRLGQSIEALEALCEELQGKFSGAVGAYNASALFFDDPRAFEEAILAKLNLKVAEHSTQIVPPESLARLLAEAVIAAGAMSNLAHDMRHLQRSELAELREKFEEGQTGSSTMAHKRNPINFENVGGLYREVLAQQLVVQQNLISEHQRDLADSSSARFYPVLVDCVAEMAKRLTKTMSKIEIDEEAMRRNLNMSKGAIGAEPLYLILGKLGHTSGHEKAKAIAHAALDAGMSFGEAVQKDEEIMNEYWDKMSDDEHRMILEPETYYTGLSHDKAKAIAAKWRQALS
jgi:adenylosuccinate lyase